MVAETFLSGPEPLVIPADSLGLLRLLNSTLDTRATRIQRFQDYYDGKQRLAFATSKFRQAFGSLFGAFADNMCALVVDAVEERLDVEGFRIGLTEGEDTDKAGDAAAWAMWQENELDAFSQIAHTESLVKEISYALVGPGTETSPEITVESALNSIVIYEAGSYRTRRAGLKRWIDDAGVMNATLYLPDQVEKYSARASSSRSGPVNWASAGWKIREVPGEDWPLANPLGVVPLVPLINRPRLDGTGQSDLASVLPIQDAINKLVMDMLVASEFSAYRQRTATGISIEIDDTTGEPTAQFQADVARIWASENENAKFGTLEASDLQPFVAGLELLVQHLASETRTPYHYFMQHGGQPPSGDSLRAAEAGLNFKAKRKQRYFGESWEEVIRLGFLAIGDTARGHNSAAETIWRDSEQRTESQVVDALVKMAGLGVPEEVLWERWGATPQEIQRWSALRAEATQVPVTVPSVQKVPETATGPVVPGVANPGGVA